MESRRPPAAPDPVALAGRIPVGARPSVDDWLDLAWLSATRGDSTSFEPLLSVEAALARWCGPAPWEADTFLEGVGATASNRSDQEARFPEFEEQDEAGAWCVLLDRASQAEPCSFDTKWLRQLPREDTSAVFTGNLSDVFVEPDLKSAALRLSQVLRVIHSRDYGRELLLEAAAWDCEPPAGYGLGCCLAAVGLATWGSPDPVRAERGRAILMRWLAHAFSRGAAIPFRAREEAEPPGADAPQSLRDLWERLSPLVATKRSSVLLGLRSQFE